MKNVDLYLNLKMWIAAHRFLKKVDLYHFFLKKSGPRPEKKWTSTCKFGPFMHDFLKN
jgi:hypothetical protein